MRAGQVNQNRFTPLSSRSGSATDNRDENFSVPKTTFFWNRKQQFSHQESSEWQFPIGGEFKAITEIIRNVPRYFQISHQTVKW